MDGDKHRPKTRSQGEPTPHPRLSEVIQADRQSKKKVRRNLQPELVATQSAGSVGPHPGTSQPSFPPIPRGHLPQHPTSTPRPPFRHPELRGLISARPTLQALDLHPGLYSPILGPFDPRLEITLEQQAPPVVPPRRKSEQNLPDRFSQATTLGIAGKQVKHAFFPEEESRRSARVQLHSEVASQSQIDYFGQGKYKPLVRSPVKKLEPSVERAVVHEVERISAVASSNQTGESFVWDFDQRSPTNVDQLSSYIDRVPETQDWLSQDPFQQEVRPTAPPHTASVGSLVDQPYRHQLSTIHDDSEDSTNTSPVGQRQDDYHTATGVGLEDLTNAFDSLRVANRAIETEAQIIKVLQEQANRLQTIDPPHFEERPVTPLHIINPIPSQGHQPIVHDQQQQPPQQPPVSIISSSEQPIGRSTQLSAQQQSSSSNIQSDPKMTSLISVYVPPTQDQKWTGKTNVQRFLETYELNSDQYGWDANRKAKQLITHIDGAARYWFKSYRRDQVEKADDRDVTEDNIILDWKELRTALIKAFPSKDTPDVIEAKLRRLKYKGAMTPEEYFYRQMRLMDKLDPVMSSERRISYLLNGLDDKTARDIFLQKPTSPNEVMDHLIQLHKFDSIKGSHKVQTLSLLESEDMTSSLTKEIVNIIENRYFSNRPVSNNSTQNSTQHGGRMQTKSNRSGIGAPTFSRGRGFRKTGRGKPSVHQTPPQYYHGQHQLNNGRAVHYNLQQRGNRQGRYRDRKGGQSHQRYSSQERKVQFQDVIPAMNGKSLAMALDYYCLRCAGK